MFVQVLLVKARLTHSSVAEDRQHQPRCTSEYYQGDDIQEDIDPEQGHDPVAGPIPARRSECHIDGATINCLVRALVDESAEDLTRGAYQEKQSHSSKLALIRQSLSYFWLD